MTHRLSFATADNEFIIDTGTNDEKTGLPIVSFDGDHEVKYSALSEPVQWEITEHRDLGHSDNCVICQQANYKYFEEWLDQPDPERAEVSQGAASPLGLAAMMGQDVSEKPYNLNRPLYNEFSGDGYPF